MITFLEEANRIKDELITIRRDLHEHPELGFEEKRTSEKIKEFLTKEGIPYVEVAKTGVCGIIKGEKEDNNRVIGLRADMDALPIQDKKVCSYSSKVPGKMHACGHDAHTTILLGVARILNKNKRLFGGCVKLFFEPAEETVGGAPFMIKEGVLENPRVDAIVGLHVTEDLDYGKIRIKSGVVNAASNPYKIKIKGRGGHGAAPHTTIDPIVIASNVVMALQTIVSREIAPVNPSVITVGSINGGTAQNVIPEEVEITGIIRTLTKEDREYVVRRFKELVTGICRGMRGECDIYIEEGYPCLYNNATMVERVKYVGKELLGVENVVEQKHPSMGVESFAFFAMERTSAFYYLGTGNRTKGTDKAAHSNLFDIDEDAIPLGVAMQCGIAYDYLTRI
ncbi:M20 family metallopeptidase [Clostridium paraputrificum]|uniref:M20 metallopeptidase family protein n=1 Tax=Clostridium TaxID=1485 RepID=UPI0006C300F5|nr:MULTISPECIES: M20 family metallopeptidase [Clostridium]MDB2087961.1 M20 family metallopeptidase [Clostridium paraputrificum]MDB2094536.1 M20 family metallopeptidase [Clostridium paraputrificum]MDU1178018.1 M20 family metallopeptidase [Clostridium sp.]MDU1225217.1 M20 family metallopeptidase [Clostridium sp.]MDU4317927.1 M20 family metallopeptidase [Clostridium sp.]